MHKSIFIGYWKCIPSSKMETYDCDLICLDWICSIKHSIKTQRAGIFNQIKLPKEWRGKHSNGSQNEM